MKLLPEAIKRRLPKLYEQERKGEDAVVYLKLFDPCSQWTWYATEFDGVDTFFGLVVGNFVEYGCFSLSELKKYRNRYELGIERDLYFMPMTLREIKQEHVRR